MLGPWNQQDSLVKRNDPGKESENAGEHHLGNQKGTLKPSFTSNIDQHIARDHENENSCPKQW